MDDGMDDSLDTEQRRCNRLKSTDNDGIFDVEDDLDDANGVIDENDDDEDSEITVQMLLILT